MKAPWLVLCSLMFGFSAFADLRVCYENYSKCNKRCESKFAEGKQKSRCNYVCQRNFDQCVRPDEDDTDEESEFFFADELSELEDEYTKPKKKKRKRKRRRRKRRSKPPVEATIEAREEKVEIESDTPSRAEKPQR